MSDSLAAEAHEETDDLEPLDDSPGVPPLPINSPPKLTPEERVQRAEEEVQAVLERYRCVALPVVDRTLKFVGEGQTTFQGQAWVRIYPVEGPSG